MYPHNTMESFGIVGRTYPRIAYDYAIIERIYSLLRFYWTQWAKTKSNSARQSISHTYIDINTVSIVGNNNEKQIIIAKHSTNIDGLLG